MIGWPKNLRFVVVILYTMIHARRCYFFDFHILSMLDLLKTRVEQKLGNFIVRQNLEEFAMLEFIMLKVHVRILPCSHYCVYMLN
jgi:hypothetical protein